MSKDRFFPPTPLLSLQALSHKNNFTLGRLCQERIESNAEEIFDNLLLTLSLVQYASSQVGRELDFLNWGDQEKYKGENLPLEARAVETQALPVVGLRKEVDLRKWAGVGSWSCMKKKAESVSTVLTVCMWCLLCVDHWSLMKMWLTHLLWTLLFRPDMLMKEEMSTIKWEYN